MNIFKNKVKTEFANEHKIFDFVVDGIDRLRRQRVQYKEYYSPASFAIEWSSVSINLGRQAGHTLASNMLYGHYEKMGYKVFIISYNKTKALGVRDYSQHTGNYIPEERCIGIRSALNPDFWRGVSFDKTIFIIDASMRSFTDTVGCLSKMSDNLITAKERPFFIGLGSNYSIKLIFNKR